MNHGTAGRFSALAVIAGTITLGICAGAGTSAERPDPAEALQRHFGVAGGLCVQVGCDDLSGAIALARSGRFLVQALDTDAAKVAQARRTVSNAGLYGLVSALQVRSLDRLPYAENLVNVVAVFGAGREVAPAEARRVLCPGGVLMAIGGAGQQDLQTAGFENLRSGDRWTAGQKPRPAEMDDWPHPRHGADGNAVSQDTIVGPPRRVRWVTGPPVEISNLVTAGGRNYYGGVWTRDAFNGLRLWQKDLRPTLTPGGFRYQAITGSVQPVAAEGRLFAWTDEKIVALDGATGELLAEYPEAGKPAQLLHVDGLLIAGDAASVRAVDVAGGALRWSYATSNPQYVVAGAAGVFFLEGDSRRGEPLAAVCLDLAGGSVRWKQAGYDWLPLVRRTVCHEDVVAFEVSTLNDDKEGNALHVASASDGKLLFSRSFVPGMNHRKQARALFVGDLLWVLEHRKCVALDPHTGEEKQACPAGFCHCFPPVATSRFLLAGEMEMTDLATGELDANRITKAACGRDAGWVPANGLIYVTPKHCVCWPMLRGYTAMAPGERGAEVAEAVAERRFPLERGEAEPPSPKAASDGDWPCYRRDAWRSGSTPVQVPDGLTLLWEKSLGERPDGMITIDWQENPFVHGPVTPPVVAAGVVYVARPDAHEVVALNAADGEVRWRFTADGRVDTAPTIHRGLCLFGAKSGWVYCLHADDGGLVWRLRAAPDDEQIVAYGQLESPWPVPGSVLIVDEVAYFAAGRQPLADGGILVFAVEPAGGRIRWVRRLDSVPTTNFYGCSGLEFDNFDLLHREDASVAMSRWLFDRATGEMTCKAAEAFAVLRAEQLSVAVPRGAWTYAPRHQPRHPGDASPMRPLATFAGNRLFACRDDHRSVFRRDFDFDGGEQFDATWITGWAAGENFRKKQGGLVWRSDRLVPGAKWTTSPLADKEAEQRVAALVLAGDRLLVAGSEGGLLAISPEDGNVLWRLDAPTPVWDGLAVADGKLFLSTQDGRVVSFGRTEAVAP